MPVGASHSSDVNRLARQTLEDREMNEMMAAMGLQKPKHVGKHQNHARKVGRSVTSVYRKSGRYNRQGNVNESCPHIMQSSPAMLPAALTGTGHMRHVFSLLSS